MDPRVVVAWGPGRPMALAPLIPPCGGPLLPCGGGLESGQWPGRGCPLRHRPFRPRWGSKGTRHSRSSWIRWP
ncbi:hypothetical protein PVAP13_2KG419458 [Panicum virgatum]|uniref:Uncharacterized protein n=1 Tax=Panicum virgatum TaxID=38727 RepID=A0A8T0W5X0_PANVG|nr:hypothetical protein PVAP13_2KG419458 [Panicum virgatum]